VLLVSIVRLGVTPPGVYAVTQAGLAAAKVVQDAAVESLYSVVVVEAQILVSEFYMAGVSV
jgi:hypothetical protein